MPHQATIYDLMLLLATSVEQERRAKIVADAESAISSGGGTLVRNDDWGTRPLAFQIDHKSDAEYHLLQFSGPTALLETLSHSLKIDDGVLRFRIIKVVPGTPPPPEPTHIPVAHAVAPTPAQDASAPAEAGPVPAAAALDAEE
jgi:small subunit ribosomal protein S6